MARQRSPKPLMEVRFFPLLPINEFKGEIDIMPVMKKNLQFKKAELIFEDDKVIVIEDLKDDVVETDLIEMLKMFKGQKGLSISVSLEENNA